MIEALQEEEYDFPYHHLVEIGPFSQTKHLYWGYMYASYIEKVLAALEERGFDSLIDIGTGDGKVLREAARRFPGKRFVGTDYSEKSLRFARAFSPTLTFAESSDERFDAFTLIEVLEHIPFMEMESFVASLRKNVGDTGYGIITTPSKNVRVIPKHVQHFDREALERALGDTFTIERFEYINADTFGSRLISRLLSNRFMTLSYPPAVAFLYRHYVRQYLHATPETGMRVFAIVRPS